MAWQAGNAIGVFLVGTLIQSIIQINHPDYAFPAWQATLLVIAAVCIALCGNVFGYKILHLWQNVVFCIHILAYFAFIIPIWVNAPRASHSAVWTEFQNDGGWYSPGFAVLVGQLSGIYTQLGIDTVSGFALAATMILTDSRPPTCQKKFAMRHKPCLKL
jgi:choline transport protein